MNKTRTHNIFWTNAENYELEPSSILFSSEDLGDNLYLHSLPGFTYKYYNLKEVENFYLLYQQGDFSLEEVRQIIKIILENNLWDHLAKDRPGVEESRKIWMKEVLRHYDFHPPQNLGQELEYGFYKVKSGTSPKIPSRLENLFRSILRIKEDSTPKLIAEIKKILDTYFHVNKSLKIDLQVDKVIEQAEQEEENYKNKSLKIKNKNYTLPEKEEIDSAELERNTLFSDLEGEKIQGQDTEPFLGKSKTLGNMNKMVQSIYGKSILSDRQKLFLENKLCTGIHSGCSLLITKGELPESDNIDFRLAERQYQKSQNMKYYKENEILFYRMIRRLQLILQESILADLEESEIRSTNGRLVPQDLWKFICLNDSYIFKKSFLNEQGSLKVDILLDSSASQQDRQAQVASQCFIITEALTRLGLPVRVFGFNNFGTHQVLRVFRDYHDDILKNQDIFEYHASGANRDGLAIKTLLALMDDKVDQSILIILSDGRPNDKANNTLKINLSKDVASYTGNLAIQDTSKQVFDGRRQNKNILGIFTGEEEDLPAEKRIYGTNFVYIKDINRFSDIVGSYLNKII